MSIKSLQPTGSSPVLLINALAGRLSSSVRREQKEKTVPAERSALSFAKRTWPGA